MPKERGSSSCARFCSAPGLVETPQGRQKSPISLVRRGMVSVELKSALELLFSAGPVPIVVVQDVRHGSMRLGQVGVELKRLCRRRFRFGESLVGMRIGVKGEASVGVRQTGVERRILRIFLDSVAEVHKRQLQIRLAALVE